MKDINEMKTMLARIAYPRRGSPDERADIYYFAKEIQTRWSLDYLLEQEFDETKHPKQ